MSISARSQVSTCGIPTGSNLHRGKESDDTQNTAILTTFGVAPGPGTPLSGCQFRPDPRSPRAEFRPEATYIEARNQMTPKMPRFSQLSASRQALVRLCQDVNFGQIQGLHVRNSDPVWDPTPTVLLEVRLDIEEGPRPEGKLPDFKLSSEIQRLMCQLDQLKDGRIR